MNAILAYLLNNFPWIAAIIIVAVVFWKMSKYHSSVEDVKETVNSINEQLLEVSKWIMRKDPKAIDIFARKCSPRRMTKIGREVFSDSGAKQALEENLDFFLGLVADKKPQTPYDVEDAALDVVVGNMSNPLFNGIKNFVYYRPEEAEYKDEEGNVVTVKLEVPIILRLMGIELRDKYLERHPELEVKIPETKDVTESNSESGEPRG